MHKNNFSIVLVAPEIPGNTGSLGRTCLGLGIPLILIHPLGFDLNEKAVRRAGLDYWKHVKCQEFQRWDDFLAEHRQEHSKFYLFSSSPFNDDQRVIYQEKFCENFHHYLIFGGESAGLPMEIKEQYPDRIFQIPMYSDHIRSLNLSNAATTVAYEVLRQLNF